MLWLLFIAIVFVFGLCIAKEFLGEERIFAAFPIGMAFSTWAVFLISFIFKFDLLAIAISCLFMLAVILLVKTGGMPKVGREALAIAVVSLLFFSFINYLFIWNTDKDGNVLSMAVSDWDYHAALISSFSYGSNFPPVYPFITTRTLTYHFLFDFFSAILVKLGASLPLAIQIPNIIVGTSMVLLLYFFALRLTKSKGAATLSLFLILFSGNFGFIEFLKILQGIPTDQIAQFLGKMGSYSTYIPDKGYLITNTIGEYTVNQHVFMSGVALMLVVLLILLGAKGKKWFFFAGVLTGLMPLFHIYSFVATILFSSAYLLLSKREGIAPFLIPAILLASPQLIYSSDKATSFLRFSPGWVGKPDYTWSSTNQGLAEFWAKNLGLYLLLSLLGFFFSSKEARIFEASALALFIFMNLFITQPLVDDNRKWVLFILIIASIASSVFIFEMVRRMRRPGVVLAVLLVLMMTLAGIQTVIAWVENYGQVMFYKNELNSCEFIKNSTEPDAVILSNAFRDCINAVSGRKVFLRTDSAAVFWLQGHGVDFGREKGMMLRMFNGDCGLLKENAVGYAYIDERNRDIPINETFFGKMDVLYNESGFRIYRIKC